MGLDLSAFLDEFRTEAGEHLRTLDAQLLALEKEPTDLAPVRAMFLAAHSLKGAGAMMDLADVEALGHAVEDVLSRLRDAKQRLDGPTADTLFRAFDLLRERIARGLPGEAPVDSPIEALVAALAACDGRADVSAAVPPAEVQPPTAAGTQRALVVEDSATVRLLHARILESTGYQVDAVADGDAALALVAQQRYDVVVVGRELAGVCGPALLEAIRERSENAPRGILTEIDEVADERGALPGVARLMIAPPDREGLTALVAVGGARG